MTEFASNLPLAGRTAIITGANQGLGEAITEAFVKAGASVALCARDEVKLFAVRDALGAEAEAAGAKIFAHKADVSSESDVDAFTAFALDNLGRVDILVNNAGVYGPMGPIEEIDWEAWKQAIDINLYGPILFCRALIPHLKRTGGGKIINLSGGGATAPLPRLSAYAASKAAIVRLTETFAHELAEFGIDVNSVAPGALNTRLLDQILESGPERVGADFYNRSIKQRDTGGASMERAAALCVWLASKQSDGITGRLISAAWDPWPTLDQRAAELKESDIYTLRRIVPTDRGRDWES